MMAKQRKRLEYLAEKERKDKIRFDRDMELQTIQDVFKDIIVNANIRSVNILNNEVRYMRYRDAKDKGSLHYVQISKDEADELRKMMREKYPSLRV
jgi:phosphoribosylanthranilate isomerase